MQSSDLRFPLFGTLPDHTIFQYLLLRLESRSALVAVPDWIILQIDPSVVNTINLHLNSCFDQPPFKWQASGLAKKLESNHSAFGRLYAVTFTHPISEATTNIEKPIDHLLNRIKELLKELLFLKKGIAIYFRHLAPFFSRISNLSTDKYSLVRNILLNDVRAAVSTKISQLDEIYTTCKRQMDSPSALINQLDLDLLNSLIVSEIDPLLFDLALEIHQPLTSSDSRKKELNPLYSCHAYLESIKCLENSLYTNFNEIALLYAHAASQLTPSNEICIPR